MTELKLLIIEDDIDQRDLMREVLTDRFGAGNVTVVGVNSRQEALGQDLNGFDLILTDYNLPDCSGMELLGDIRARSATPVIMVTGENVGGTAAEAIRRGATDYVVKVGDYLFTIPLVVEKSLTVARIMRENESLREELQRAIFDVNFKNEQLQKSLKRVEELAATDPLTGLYNRRQFATVLEQLFAAAQRYDQDLSAVMIDLDGYKQLNDSYGHQIGDQFLVLAGKVIRANLRRMDVAARYGGDEFVLLLPHAGQEDAVVVARRIRDEFRTGSAIILRRNEGVGMSMGVSSLSIERPTGADQLVARADAALYRAKEQGRNRIEVGNGIAA